MRTGRPPKPLALKRLEGNPGKRKLPDSPLEFAAPTSLEPPPFLDDLAKKHWAMFSAVLAINRILTQADIPALAALCQCYARWQTAEEVIREMAKHDPYSRGLLVYGERGRQVQNPLVRIAQAAREQMLKIAQQFGMTPASRAGISFDDEDDEDDLWAALLKKEP